MSGIPSKAELSAALAVAGKAHHDYEQRILKGVRDELWAGFYAAFLLGRFGDFAPAGRLARILEEVDASGDWNAAAAEHIVTALA